jgi:hypothetical protein
LHSEQKQWILSLEGVLEIEKYNVLYQNYFSEGFSEVLLLNTSLMKSWRLLRPSWLNSIPSFDQKGNIWPKLGFIWHGDEYIFLSVLTMIAWSHWGYDLPGQAIFYRLLKIVLKQIRCIVKVNISWISFQELVCV